MLSRIIYGARIALVVGIVVGPASPWSSASRSGWSPATTAAGVDAVIMRVMDGLFAFPIIILAIAMMAVMGFGVKNVIIAVAVGFIAPFARVTRADVLAVKEEPYIEAARLGGVSSLAIIARHVLPNVTGAHHRAGRAARLRRDHHRGRAVVPRPRPAAARRRCGAR